uniref:NAD-dependent DNA ligase adenylation domain-containing protein n=1 Tax=Glossina austeni TaxID=7395 RepID=A0A1A9UKD4_GLOAU
MFYGYGIGYSAGYNLPDSQYKRLEILKLWNIPINNHVKICTDFEIDGVVIKVNSILNQKKIGCVTKTPKWAIAYKFPASEAITQIINVNFTIGRTGIVTPIAQVKPN